MEELLNKYYKQIFIILVIAGFISIFIPWLSFDKCGCHHDSSFKSYGDLGGFITGITAPFLGLITIVFLFGTYTTQKRELETTKQALAIQSFENTFFNLIENFQKIVDAMDLERRAKNKNPIKSRDCFKEMHRQMRDGLFLKNDDDLYVPKLYDVLFQYNKTQDEHKNELHHYYRLLYNILKFVKESEAIPKYEQKYKYTSIVRAMLSPYELVFVSFNCLHEFGSEKFFPLIVEFSFLKNIDDSLLLYEKLLKEYPSLAYSYDLTKEKRIKLHDEWIKNPTSYKNPFCAPRGGKR